MVAWLFYLEERIRAQLPGSFGHFINSGRKQWGIGGTNIEHLNTLRFYPHLFQQFLHLLDPLLRSQISFQEMTIAFLSAGDEGSINPVLEGFQQMERVHFTCTH